MKLKYAELNQPLFLNGKNFGTKLDSKRNIDLSLLYDVKERELTVEWKGQMAIFPNFNGYVVKWDDEVREPVVRINIPAGKIKAQVSTPQNIKERE